MVQPVRLAFLGCGFITAVHSRHLRALGATEAVTAYASRDRAKADEYCRRFGGAQAYVDYDAAIDDPGVDAVVVAVPPKFHLDLTVRALERGKHVLIEKPLATTVEHSEALAQLAAARQLTLMVGHTFVFSPPVRKVKELIDSGQIGPIYYVETTRVNLGLFQKDVSVLWDLGPHDVSILNYWLGEVPVQVSARGRSFQGEALEDVAFLTLEFPSGILAQVQISWLAPSKLRRTSVVGRQRMIVYDDLEPVEKVKIFDRGVDRQPASFGEFQLTYRSGDILSPRLDTTEPLYVECEHFLECIRTGREPDTSPRSGVDVVRVIQAAERSLRQGGAPQTVG